MRKKGLMALGLAMGISLSMSLLSYANPTQSARWVGSGDRWQVSDNQGGFIKDCWFEDDITHHWYMIGAEDGSVMYSGLVTDKSTGKSYLLNVNHDGTFGRMITVDGVYNINGVDVYMTFNQAHDGSFGAITSGLSEVRNTGVNERQLDRIPTDNGSGSNADTNNKTSTDSTQYTYDPDHYYDWAKPENLDELMESIEKSESYQEWLNEELHYTGEVWNWH